MRTLPQFASGGRTPAACYARETMETGESVAVGGLAKELKEKCPYKDEEAGVDNEDEEGLEEDDDDGVQEEQQNNGGTLGENLVGGLHGADGTFCAPLPPKFKSAPNDSARGRRQPMVRVGTDDIEEDEYRFTVAAHHLIPGNASLGRSAVYDYLGPPGSGKLKGGSGTRKRKQVTVKFGTKSRKVKFKKLIGYNINGSHNGAWLAGNYAIRKSESPGGRSWGKLSPKYDEWKLYYVAAATKASGGQFHDAHTLYSGRVLGLLNKIATLLGSHLLSSCPECGKDDTPLLPPFDVKERFYAISGFLRGKVQGGYVRRKEPWFTSDHWGNLICGSADGLKRYRAAWQSVKVVRG
jgi:hypothetical protein